MIAILNRKSHPVFGAYLNIILECEAHLLNRDLFLYLDFYKIFFYKKISSSFFLLQDHWQRNVLSKKNCLLLCLGVTQLKLLIYQRKNIKIKTLKNLAKKLLGVIAVLNIYIVCLGGYA